MAMARMINNRPDATEEQLALIKDLVFSNNSDDLGRVEKLIEMLRVDIRKMMIPFAYIVDRVNTEGNQRRKYILSLLLKITHCREYTFRSIIRRRWTMLKFDDKSRYEVLDYENRIAMQTTDSVSAGSVLYISCLAPEVIDERNAETVIASLLYDWYDYDEYTQRIYEYLERADFKEGFYVKQLAEELAKINVLSVRIPFIIEVRTRRMKVMQEAAKLQKPTN